MTETNPFLYFIPPKAEKLIIGSFPCYNGKDYGDWFYSGSGKNHFWQLLSEVFDMPAGNKAQKTAICVKHRIALTDIGLKIERRQNNCSDANLTIVEFNKEGIDTCLNTGIKKIFFTSRFVEKHFRRHYPGLALPCSVLVSPSPSANKHIGGLDSFKKMKLQKKLFSTYDYRLLNYRELLRD